MRYMQFMSIAFTNHEENLAELSIKKVIMKKMCLESEKTESSKKGILYNNSIQFYSVYTVIEKEVELLTNQLVEREEKIEQLQSPLKSKEGIIMSINKNVLQWTNRTSGRIETGE